MDVIKSKIKKYVKVSGVYAIINTTNLKMYIGSSEDIMWRLYQHKRMLKSGKHHSIILQRGYDKYGHNNFLFLVLKEVSLEKLLLVEGALIKEIRPAYNVCQKAIKGFTGKHSKASIAKIVKNNPNKRVVVVIDCFGKILHRFESSASAGRCYNEGRSQINNCASGITKYSIKHGVFFCFEDDVDDVLERVGGGYVYTSWNKGVTLSAKQRNKLPWVTAIKVTNTTTGEVTNYESQKNACEAIGMQPCSLNRCLKSGRPHRRGYKFELI